jgi:hypothetical protein
LSLRQNHMNAHLESTVEHTYARKRKRCEYPIESD